MLFSQIYSTFKVSLRWNAALFFTYKAFFTLTSLLLFNRLSVNNFSVWANLNSFIFLLILWLDLGFRKSIPCYCSGNPNGAISFFLPYLLAFHAAILIIALPFFIMVSKFLFFSMNLIYDSRILYLAAIIVLTEGLNSTIKLFYHALFLNKHYTLLQTVLLLLHAFITLICVLFMHSEQFILLALFACKLTASVFNVIISLAVLWSYKRTNRLTFNASDETWCLHEFIYHSSMMWLGNSIKSLSERNFLVPFITRIANPATANLFKIANDWALLIHRPIIKTISTSDTALLARARSCSSITGLQAAKRLTFIVKLMCVPCGLGAIFILFIIPGSTFLFFLLLSSCHVIETILSPYERLLEVNRCYKSLICAYSPYILILVIVGYLYSNESVNLITAISTIYMARLISSGLIAIIAHTSQTHDTYVSGTSLLARGH